MAVLIAACTLIGCSGEQTHDVEVPELACLLGPNCWEQQHPVNRRPIWRCTLDRPSDEVLQEIRQRLGDGWQERAVRGVLFRKQAKWVTKPMVFRLRSMWDCTGYFRQGVASKASRVLA
jgi:hypothetical protein